MVPYKLSVKMQSFHCHRIKYNFKFRLLWKVKSKLTISVSGPNLKIRTVSDIGRKTFFFFKKRVPKISSPPINLFLSILHQNKALHNFRKIFFSQNSIWLSDTKRSRWWPEYIRPPLVDMFIIVFCCIAM